MTSPSYVTDRRGDRLRPSLLSTRYHHLRQLSESFRAIADSELLRSGRVILDFGCAKRPYERLFTRKFNTYLGADLRGNDVADIEIADNGTLPCPSGAIDCVLSSQVLEHVAEPSQYLAEVSRVLHFDGQLILSTHGSWQYHPDPQDYWRWTLNGLRLQLARAGFRLLLEYAVLGRTSTALQLLQDALIAPVPRVLRPIPAVPFQLLIGAIERMRGNTVLPDASAYVVLAQKSGHTPTGSTRLF